MTDEDVARQIAANPETAPEMAPVTDVRAIRQAAGMTQAQFDDAYAVARDQGRPGRFAKGARRR